MSIFNIATSSNSLIGKLIREAAPDIKTSMEDLMNGKILYTQIDEQIVYNQLDGNDAAIWSLLVASGYLKVISYEAMDLIEGSREPLYELALTNYEVKSMFYKMVRDWFGSVRPVYHNFMKAMMLGDLDAMNMYMNRITKQVFSYFDTSASAADSEPERFYHGFVLGLLVDMDDRYIITSNRESGFGRYDIIMEPKNRQHDAIIVEFKVLNAKREKTLEDTVSVALQQIEEKQYKEVLIAKGIEESRIRKYGFAFEGKKVLIG